MPVIEDIVDKVIADIAAAIPAVTFIKSRRSLQHKKSDPTPAIIVSGQAIDREPHTGEDSQAWIVLYRVNVMYVTARDNVTEDSTINTQLETLRNLYSGYPDLVVSGVVINDVNHTNYRGNSAALVRKGKEVVAFTWLVETIEGR